MSRFDKDNAIFKIETAVEKADYLAKSLIQNYNLDAGAVTDEIEALVFAGNRENIGMEMEILCDYIDSIQSSLKSFGEAVSA